MIRDAVASALKEDLGDGDVTVRALVPRQLGGTGTIVAKENGVLSGIEPARQVFLKVDPELSITETAREGARLSTGQEIMRISGCAASLLEAERTALNFLQHLSGIASITSRFTEAIAGTGAKILDTRKTVPGLRALEKAAVLAGGGTNHRMGLYDMILIKDNHLALYDDEDEKRAVHEAVTLALEKAPAGIRVQVEVTSLDSALEAGKCGAHMLLLDNMSPEAMTDVMKALVVEFGEDRPLVEASGGITLAGVRGAADSGVDRISIGGLTHSAAALDIAMYIGFDGGS